MKYLKFTLLIALMTVCSTQCFAEKKFSAYAVGFYNLENLFDTIHDAGKNDYEYLPTASGKWNTMKYTSKLANMSRVLSEMGTDLLKGVGCAMIGVTEIENDNVLTDLCNQEPLKERGYNFIHIEGPDRRGIDCALLYNPKFFTPERAVLHPYVPELAKDSGYVTRGFLTITGSLAGEHVGVVINHWPSRFATGYYRDLAGKQVRVVKDSLLKADPDIKIFIMGDMNDDPFCDSMAKHLGARQELKDVEDGGLWNPWWNILAKEGRGTLLYDGSWNLFDQIVMNSNLLNRDGRNDFSTLKYYKHNVFSRDYLFQTDGKYKGSPLRTKAGGAWLNGYSDHLPVVVYLLKEQK
ncbi:MAG: endonuclease/exonuclease/phosphatase family protein [Prevotellaceae bacterium]|nr:endonuclease/exonuclease/phosphatase family protein [Prevotellaceae bacterium]